MINKFFSDTAQKRINVTYELFILILATASIVWIILIYFAPLPDQFLKIIQLFDGAICFIFLFDFFRSLVLAIDKGSFLKWGWFDLISNIPYLFIFRILRLARIIRAFHNLRAAKSKKVFEHFSRRKDESLLLGTALTVIFVILFSSLLIYHLESNNPSGNISTGFDAIWWALVTITTIGYGDFFPVTDSGRLVAAVVIIVGVALFGVFTSYLASTFLTQRTREQEKALKELKKDLDQIKQLLNNEHK